MTEQELCRLDYSSFPRQYVGITSEIADISNLPTDGVPDGSTFMWLDTSQTAMYYKGSWYLIR